MTDPVVPTDQQPASTPPATTPTTPTPSGDNDTIKMAQELGELRKAKTDLEDFQKKVTPILETLWSDQELLDKATQAHNKRLGIKTSTPPADPIKKDETPTTPVVDTDLRNSQISMIQEKFEEKVGISKLPEKDQAAVRGMVGQMLKEMVDPKGNKTIQQVFDEISLTKLPWYLEKAYNLVNRDKDIQAATEQGKNLVLQQYAGDVGMIGSIAGGSVPTEEVTLTPAEMRAADNMGISHETYLKNKKEILSLRN